MEIAMHLVLIKALLIYKMWKNQPNAELYLRNARKLTSCDIEALLNTERESHCDPCPYCSFLTLFYICGWGAYPPTPFPYLSPNRPPPPRPRSRYTPTSPASSTSNECDHSIKLEYINLYREFKHASQMELMDLISSSGGEVDTSVSDGRQLTHMTNLDPFSATPQTDNSPQISPQDEAVEKQINDIIDPYISRIFTRLVEDFLKSFEEMTKGLIMLKETGITLDDICSMRESHVCECQKATQTHFEGSTDTDGIPLKPYDASEFEKMLRNVLKSQYQDDLDNILKRSNHRGPNNNPFRDDNQPCECEQVTSYCNPFVIFLTEITGPNVSKTQDQERGDCETILRKEKKKFLKNCLKVLRENEPFGSRGQLSPMSNDIYNLHVERSSPVLDRALSKANINIELSANIYNLTVCHVQYATLLFFKSNLAHRAEPKLRTRRLLPQIPDESRPIIERSGQTRNQIGSLVKCLKSPDTDDVFITETLTRNDDEQYRGTPENSQRTFQSTKYAPDKELEQAWPSLKYEEEVNNRIRQYKSVRGSESKRRHSQYEQFERKCSMDDDLSDQQYNTHDESHLGSQRHTYYGNASHHQYPIERQYSAIAVPPFNRGDTVHTPYTQYHNLKYENELERCRNRITTLNEEMRKVRNIPMHINHPPRVPYTSHKEDFTITSGENDYASHRGRFKSEPIDSHRTKYAYETNMPMSDPEEHISLSQKRRTLYKRKSAYFRPVEYDQPLAVRIPRSLPSTGTRNTSLATNQSAVKVYDCGSKRRLSYTYTRNLPNHKNIIRTYSLPSLGPEEKGGRNIKHPNRWTDTLNFKDAVTNILNIWTYDMISYEKGAKSPRVRSQILNRRKKMAVTIQEKIHYRHIISVFKRIETHESPILEFKEHVPSQSNTINMRRTSSCHAELKYNPSVQLYPKPMTTKDSTFNYKDDVSIQIKAWKHELLELEEEARSPYLEMDLIKRKHSTNPFIHTEQQTILRRPRSESIESKYLLGSETLNQMTRPRSLHSEPTHTATAPQSKHNYLAIEDDISSQIKTWKQELSELEDSVGSPHSKIRTLPRQSIARARSLQSEHTPVTAHRPKSEFAEQDFSSRMKTWKDQEHDNKFGMCHLKPETLIRKNMARASSLQEPKIIPPVVHRPKSDTVEYQGDYLAQIDTWKHELHELEKSVKSPYLEAGMLNRKHLARATSFQEQRVVTPAAYRAKSEERKPDILKKIDNWKQELLELENTFLEFK